MFWSDPPRHTDGGGRQKDNRFVLVDWQCTGAGRVVWELAYFLRNFPHNPDLEAHVLNEYYDALCKYNERAGNDYPRETFLRDFYLVVIRRAVHFLMEVWGSLKSGSMEWAKRPGPGFETGQKVHENAKEMVRYQLQMTKVILQLEDAFGRQSHILAGFIASPK